MLCALLLSLVVVLQLAPGAAETSFADRGASESSSVTQQSSERLRLIVEQQRTTETDRAAAETSATDEAARELGAEMAATLGRIEEFDGDKEEWSQYQERLEYFFQANGIENADKKCAVFLSLIGASTYKRLRNLIAPAKPDTKTYAQLVKALADHFSPTPTESVQRFKFHSRVRRPGESVATFVSELRCLAEFCNFGAALEDMLRDCLVCGINDAGIQRRLLAESTLSFKKAFELAQGLESAAQNVKQLQSTGSRQEVPGATGTTHMQGVHKVSHPDQRKPDSGANCYRCGKPGHSAAKCRFKDAKCHYCGKTGHIKAVCRMKQKTAAGKKPQSVRVVQQEEEANEYPLFHMESAGRSKPLTVTIAIEDCPVVMEVDTGAALSIVSEATFKELWPDKSPSSSNVRLCSYSGEAIPVVGSMDVNINYKGQAAQLPLVVVKGEGPNLLGRNWLEQIRLDWREIHYLQDKLMSVVAKHEELFQGGLGKLRGHKVRILVDLDAKPRFCKARTIPYAFKAKVEDELERLVKEGTLEPVQFSEWAAPIVPVLKSDKSSIRICGDFRLTVNPVSKLDRYPIPKVEDLLRH